MDLDEAWAALEVESSADEAQVRAAYRRLVRSTHPDLSGDTDATMRTIELTRAYAIVRAAQRRNSGGMEIGKVPARAAPAAGRWATPSSSVRVTKIAEDTIGISAPPPEAFRILIDTMASLGEVTYADRGCGLVEVVIEFAAHGACQVVLALRDDAAAPTELSLTVESYHLHPPPRIGEVTRIIVDALSGAV